MPADHQVVRERRADGHRRLVYIKTMVTPTSGRLVIAPVCFRRPEGGVTAEQGAGSREKGGIRECVYEGNFRSIRSRNCIT